jgi:phage terminase large subunit GpA-like protein
MRAVTERDTHTVTLKAGTQILKSELLTNVALFYIHQDPSPILLVQPSQAAAEAFSKERFATTVAVTPAVRNLVKTPKSRDSDNTITHKDYPGGSLDFVGANSPTDLASRPKRIVLADEVNKYPPSAGAEGDPLTLAEERASTYKALGRAKFVRACSPTHAHGRISREYASSDQRKLFVACPHCGHEQILTWAHVVWDKDEAGEHLPDTAGILCAGPDCGAIWSERDRFAALAALEFAPDYGWRQTRKFSCCGEAQPPEAWEDRGRSLCRLCGARSAYDGHAGFHVSKLYSARHRLPELVREFVKAKGDPELLRKWTNTGLAEDWAEERAGEQVDGAGLIARAEPYGPDDLPVAVQVVTGFCDVQGDRLEVQLIGWGHAEEAWPFLYEIIHQDPAQPAAWLELDTLLRRIFKTRDGRTLRVAAFGMDTGGHHGAQVYAFCRQRRGRRLFACQGIAGPSKPIWPMRPTRSKTNEPLWLIGVDGAKDAIMGRLRIAEPGPGYVHFPTAEGFEVQYFEQLTAERREQRYRMGQPYTVWVPTRRRNEALDTFVGALAVRRSLPRQISDYLEYRTMPNNPAGAPDGLALVEPDKLRHLFRRRVTRSRFLMD